MKKLVFAAAILMLCVMAMGCFAEAVVPSVEIEVFTKVEAKTEVESMVIVLDAEKLEEQEAMTEMIAALENVIEYYAPEVMESVAQIVPEGTDMAALTLHEFYTVDVINYSESENDVEAVFEFATQYEEGMLLVAMIGILPEGGEGEIVWMPLNAQVVEGKVKILFTKEVLDLISAGEAVCALLGA